MLRKFLLTGFGRLLVAVTVPVATVVASNKPVPAPMVPIPAPPLQVMVPTEAVLPSASVPATVNCWVSSAVSVGVSGLTVSVARAPTVTVTVPESSLGPRLLVASRRLQPLMISVVKHRPMIGCGCEVVSR